MRLPKDIDAVDLLYAIDSLTSRVPLRDIGLNRAGLRGAKKAQKWFFDEMAKAIRVRIVKAKGKNKRRSSKRGIAPAL